MTDCLGRANRLLMAIALLTIWLALRSASPLQAQTPPDTHLEFDLLTPQVGWVRLGQQLYVTATGGRSWQEITPPNLAGFELQAVWFSDPAAGWLVLTRPEPTGDLSYALAHTTTGGRNWSIIPLSLFAPGDPAALAGAISIRFEDPQRGRLAIKQATSANFRRGTIFTTTDGGRTWRRLNLPPDDFRLTAATRLTTPVMAGDRVGWRGYERGECYSQRCRRAVGLLHTADSGQTWLPLPLPGGEAALGQEIEVGSGLVSLAGGSETAIFSGQGFDKCEVASLDQLQNWFEAGPYRAVNLYIGGVSRYCANSGLSADLITALSGQGWYLIPTWVGPQAACTSYTWRMSADPATAYGQGQVEAAAAVTAAHQLGLTQADQSGTIIYYDLENYDYADAGCHAAARAFIAGWTAGLHGANNLAGVYSTGPVLSGMADLEPVADAIWPAHWLYSGYTPTATVWDVYHLSNTLWSNWQRIRQYSGPHNETWGSLTLNIDSNVIVGIVAAPHRQKLYLPLIWRE